MTTDHDVYEGFFIPKGESTCLDQSVVHLHICAQIRLSSPTYGTLPYIDLGIEVAHCRRAMTHNEEKYPSPMEFSPERYIAADGSLTDDIAEQQFGFGRRSVGVSLVLATIILTLLQNMCREIPCRSFSLDSHGNHACRFQY